MRRLKELEGENAKLKRLVAEQMLAIDGMKEIIRVLPRFGGRLS